MVVGYSLGSRNNNQDEIQVIGEDDPSVITYTKSFPIVLSRMCRNSCPYCGFNRKDNIIVPYSTIRMAKDARSAGTREVHFVSGERPDKYPHIRANLDLWGFDSYIDYVYTVCELAFLEGLIPIIELGFLSPAEMKRLTEVSALCKIMLDSVDTPLARSMYQKSPGKKFDLRLKSLQWAGKLKFPTITGIMVGIGESKQNRRFALTHIAELHRQYGHIHEVLIQNFVPEQGTPFEKKIAPDIKEVLDTIELAKEILPEDVSVTTNIELNEAHVEDFIKAGIRDLGRITFGPRKLIRGQSIINEDDLRERVERMGFRLQQRFPLRREFIKEGKYSKKLGQVFENYKYKIKKEGQEKQKAAKEE